jgi:hypothetical protein
MKIVLSDRASIAIADAPRPVRKAFHKPLVFLERDLHHPSLHAKKYDEARDIILDDAYVIRDVVPHPTMTLSSGVCPAIAGWRLEPKITYIESGTWLSSRTRAAFTRSAPRRGGSVPSPRARRQRTRSRHQRSGQIIVDELREDGIPLPAASDDDVEVFEGTRVAVTV